MGREGGGGRGEEREEGGHACPCCACGLACVEAPARPALQRVRRGQSENSVLTSVAAKRHPRAPAMASSGRSGPPTVGAAAAAASSCLERLTNGS